MKKMQGKQIAAVLIAAVITATSIMPVSMEVQAQEPEGQINLNVMSDIHYLPLSLSGGQSTETGSDWRLHSESTAAVDEAIRQVIENKPEVLLITGDITDNGEKAGAVEIAEKLKAVEEAGIKVYVINGNHDIYSGNSEQISPEDFRSIFRDYGYDGKDHAEYYQPLGTENENAVQGGLSYAVNLKEHVRLVMVDSEVYTEDYSSVSDGMISDGLLGWVKDQVQKAEEQNDTLIVGMHHPLLPHYSGTTGASLSDTVDKSSAVAEALADAGVKFIFTGHMHENDIAEYTSKAGNRILDMETGSLVAYGAPLRSVSVSGDSIMVQAKSISQINWQGNRVNYADYMEERLFAKGFFTTKAMTYVDRYLNDAVSAGLKETVEEIAGLDLDKTVLGLLRENLKEPVRIDLNMGQVKSIVLSYQESDDPSVLVQAETKNGSNKNFPDLVISVKNKLLPALDGMIAQVEQKWFTDTEQESKLEQKVRDLVQTLAVTEVYNDGKGFTKDLSDFIGEMLMEHNLGGESLSGWKKEVSDGLRCSLLRTLIQKEVLPAGTELVENILEDTTLDLQELTGATNGWTGVLGLFGDAPSLSSLLGTAKVDLGAIFEEAVYKYLNDDDILSKLGRPLSQITAGFLEDTPGGDDKVDGLPVTYHFGRQPSDEPPIKEDTKAPVLNVPGKPQPSIVKAPGRAKIALAVRKGKKVVLKLKKIKGAKGYTIQYSTGKKFKKRYTKTITIKGTKKTIKKLKANKKYYIRVRAYKVSGNKKVYGKWSGTKVLRARH